MRLPHLRVTRRHGNGAAMCSRGVIVHGLSRLGTAVAVLAAKLSCCHGVFTEWALKLTKAVHHFDGIMSHSLKSNLFARYILQTKVILRPMRLLKPDCTTATDARPRSRPWLHTNPPAPPRPSRRTCGTNVSRVVSPNSCFRARTKRRTVASATAALGCS
jgi:hypothetical protein